MQFLGAVLDSFKGEIQIAEHRKTKALCTCSSLIEESTLLRSISVRKIACFVGQIISMSIVIGNIAQIKTRYLTFDINSAISWNSKIRLTEESVNELQFWQANLSKLNKNDIF